MKKWPIVALADLIDPSGSVGGAGPDLPVYSVTKHSGFVPSLEYFKKQVFSKDISKYKVVEKGEFAYATIHLDEGSVGVAPERALISPMYTVFKIDPNQVDSRYLLAFLKSQRALHFYALVGQGAVHRRKSISLKALGHLEVPLPPLDEQHRIAAILDRSARHLSATSHSSQLITILQRQSFTKLFGSPSSWADRWPMTKVGDVVASTQYGTSEKSSTFGPTPVLRMGNLTVDGRLDLGDLKYMTVAEKNRSKHTVQRGDILFNRTNSPDLVGKTAVVRTDDEYAYAGYLIRVRVSEDADPEFVAGYLNSEYGKILLRSMCKSIVGQANINAEELRSIPIAVPPRDLQSKFATLVTKAEEERARIEERGQALKSLQASLQSRAFRGEL